MVQPRGDPGQVAHAVTVRVRPRPRVDLVDDGVTPPLLLSLVLRHEPHFSVSLVITVKFRVVATPRWRSTSAFPVVASWKGRVLSIRWTARSPTLTSSPSPDLASSAFAPSSVGGCANRVM